MILLEKEILVLKNIVENLKRDGVEIPKSVEVITNNIFENINCAKDKGEQNVCYSILSLKSKENLKTFLNFFVENKNVITFKKDLKHYKNLEKIFCLEFLKLDYKYKKVS